jgi:hypothetical protein
MLILIGSRALAFRSSLNRKPKDFDFISTKDSADKWIEDNLSKINPDKITSTDKRITVEGKVNCEFELITPGTSSELIADFVSKDNETMDTKFGLVPNIDMLFLLKQSHRYLKNSPHFWKTCFDWHAMRKDGCVIRSEYQDLLKLREKETYNYKHPRLNQDKKDFFEDGEALYKYDHDSLHFIVKNLDKPAYAYYMKDDCEVMSDKNKFFKCDEKIRLCGVYEECCVLALERSIIPYPNAMDVKCTFLLAFSKLATSVTSGFFRQYAYENVYNIIKMYNEDFYKKYKCYLNNGMIKRYNKKYE